MKQDGVQAEGDDDAGKSKKADRQKLKGRKVFMYKKNTPDHIGGTAAANAERERLGARCDSFAEAE